MSKELGVFWINPAVHPLPITKNLKLCVTAENSTSVSTLRRLARNKEWKVRALVACNHLTPVSVLRKLTTDKHVDVRKSAICNLDAKWRRE